MPVLNGLGQLPEQVANLNNAVNKVNPNAVSALNGYTSIRNALEEQLIPGATQLNGGLNEAVEGSNQLTAATQSLNERTPELVKGINQLAQGGSSLNNGLSKLTGDLVSWLMEYHNCKQVHPPLGMVLRSTHLVLAKLAKGQANWLMGPINWMPTQRP